MAKNTLSFSEIVHEGTVGGGEILSKGFLYVKLEAGETIRVAGEQEVSLIDKEDLTIVADLSGSAYTNDSEVMKEYYLAVDREYADVAKKIVYEIVGGSAIGAGFSENPAPNKVTAGGVEYPVDPATDASPLVLEEGDGIELHLNHGGETPALFIYTRADYQGDAVVEELSGMHVAKGREFVKIVALPQYRVLNIEYRLFHHYEAPASVFVPGAAVCTESIDQVKLEVGEVIVNNTSESELVIFDIANQRDLVSLAKDERYECAYRCDVALFSQDASIGVTYTKKDVRPEYEAEYSGGSGILQLRHEMGARVKVYGDAGAGYMLIHEMEGKEIVRAVNMDGFNSLKFVSDGPVDTCIINEF